MQGALPQDRSRSQAGSLQGSYRMPPSQPVSQDTQKWVQIWYSRQVSAHRLLRHGRAVPKQLHGGRVEARHHIARMLLARIVQDGIDRVIGLS